MSEKNHQHSHSFDLKNNKKYILGISLNLAVIVIEIIVGHIANSLGLISDAMHNLSDVFGIVIAFIASILSGFRPTREHTYGLRTTSILAAFINAVILPAGMIVLIVLAVMRLIRGEAEVNGILVTIFAILAILVNLLTAWLFAGKSKTDLNEHMTFMHFLADALVSLAVVIAGTVIAFTHWNWLDPVVTILAALFIIYESLPLLRDAWNIVTSGVPNNVDEQEVKKYLLSIPEIKKINDLHIWAISTTENAMTAHLQCDQPKKNTLIIDKVTNDLRDKYNIDHVTLQLEEKNFKHSEFEV